MLWYQRGFNLEPNTYHVALWKSIHYFYFPFCSFECTVSFCFLQSFHRLLPDITWHQNWMKWCPQVCHVNSLVLFHSTWSLQVRRNRWHKAKFLFRKDRNINSPFCMVCYKHQPEGTRCFSFAELAGRDPVSAICSGTWFDFLVSPDLQGIKTENS